MPAHWQDIGQCNLNQPDCNMMMSQNPQTIAMRRIDRALHELRAGYPVVVEDEAQRFWLVMSAEMANHARRDALLTQCDAAALVITGIRAKRLALEGATPQEARAIAFDCLTHRPDVLEQCIDPLQTQADMSDIQAHVVGANLVQAEALTLCKLAALLPAAITGKLTVDDAQAWTKKEHILSIGLADIAAYKDGLHTTLYEVSSAHVPLRAFENVHVKAFRPRYGNAEHLVVCVGEPHKQSAPLVRVHSSCVTGDIFGSLRCDCGEQLHEAIARMAQQGHGVLLYMSQEGRGIGIVNKLRAYELQDAGLDTLDANEAMGFEADERQFNAAAHILKLLGHSSICLLSNNPDKVTQLEENGIIVNKRVSLALPANAHNHAYLTTKEKRCGHVF
ncbi:MAG: GTP cyclohydrolase II [Alphaproteobacteria bacterium]|nr:GTP cyclohydrolase II [Alphaproteobacteria bacterium]